MTAGDDLHDLVRTRRLVVVDFDGPVARLLPGESYLRVARGARDLATTYGADIDDPHPTDHVEVLRAVHARDHEVYRLVERWCTEEEDAAARLVDPYPSAVALAEVCAARGVPLAVVTNNAPSSVTLIMARGGPHLAALPVHGREPEHPQRLKPAPDMLLDAAAAAGVDPAEAVMVGDSATDVQAAAAAGMPCIGLGHEAARRESLMDAGAVGTVDSLADLLPPP